MRLRAARRARHRRRRPRALRDGLERRGRVAARAHDVEARLRVARLAGRLRLLPERDGASCADVVLPVDAVGRGRRHDDEPRRPRHPPPAGRRAADGVRTRHRHPRATWPSGSASGEKFAFARREDVFDELRRATAGGAADYSGHHLRRRSTRERRRLLAVPVAPSTPARRACSPSASPTPSGKARFHAVEHRPPAEEPDEDYPLFLTTGRVQGALQSGAQTRRVPALDARPGRGRARAAPADGGAAERGRRRPRWRVKSRRGQVEFVTARSRRDIRPDTLFVPFHWGGRAVGQPAHQPGARPDQPDARVQGLRGARGPRRLERQPGPGSQQGHTLMTSSIVSWSSATAWRAPASSKTCSPAPAAIAFDVTMFGDEPHGNYNRILLSSVLAGTQEPKDIFLNPLAWYAENGVTLHAGVGASRSRPRGEDRSTAPTAGPSPTTRSCSPPGRCRSCRRSRTWRRRAGARLRTDGVFVFRTLDDCEHIAGPRRRRASRPR